MDKDPFGTLLVLRMVGGHSHMMWFGVMTHCGEGGFSLSIVGSRGWSDQLSPFGSGASIGLLVWDKSPLMRDKSPCVGQKIK